MGGVQSAGAAVSWLILRKESEVEANAAPLVGESMAELQHTEQFTQDRQAPPLQSATISVPCPEKVSSKAHASDCCEVSNAASTSTTRSAADWRSRRNSVGEELRGDTRRIMHEPATVVS